MGSDAQDGVVGTARAGGARRAPMIGLWLAVAGFALLGAVLTDTYVQHVLILCFLWCIVAAAWDLALGYAGIYNYAQLVFFAAGAYATAILGKTLGVPPIAAILAASLVAGIAGLLVGLPCLRLKGEYVALFTFAVHLAMPPLIQQTKSLGSGGTMGLFGIPPIEVLGITFNSQSKIAWYYLALAVAALAVHAVYFVVLASRTGRAFVALRDSEHFARSLGVDELRYKLIAFTLSAAVTGLAGSLYASYTSVVTPKILGNEFFLLVMVMLAIGGIGRFPGAVSGAFIVTILNEALRSAGTLRLLALGLLVILTLLLLPRGIVSLRERLRRWPGGRRSVPRPTGAAPSSGGKVSP